MEVHTALVPLLVCRVNKDVKVSPSICKHTVLIQYLPAAQSPVVASTSRRPSVLTL